MNNKSITFLGLLFLVVATSVTTLIFSGNTYGLIGKGYTKEELAFFEKFIASKDLIKDQFYKETDDSVLYEGAFHGMADSLGDPYSAYLEKSQNDTLSTELEGQYCGIGVYVAKDYNDNRVTVVDIIKGSPAEESGIEILDKIIAIDGKEYTGDAINEAVSNIKGPAGKEIILQILRGNEKLEKKVTRREIILKHIEYENKKGIGYIKISSFDENSSKDFNEAYDKLLTEGIKGLIIDLRDNGGGIYEETIEIAKRIVPAGLIVYTEDRTGKQDKSYSEGEGIKIPLIVLINASSASASEVLAGAIKDRGVGKLVGETTFGKGLVQGWYKMTDGTSIRVTIARYFTPNGICINGIGIAPDIEVENDSYKIDKQLNKAIEILNKEIQ